jgi:hypothetical protein
MATNYSYAIKISTLAQAIDGKTQIDPKAVSAILMDVSKALQEMHARIEALEEK